MQADVTNARKQYAISGGGAAKRCHTGFGSTFCFGLGKVGKLERPRPTPEGLGAAVDGRFLNAKSNTDASLLHILR